MIKKIDICTIFTMQNYIIIIIKHLIYYIKFKICNISVSNVF